MTYLLLLLFLNTAVADETSFSYGVGVLSSNQTKIIGIDYRTDIQSGFYWNFNGKYWVDASGDPTRSNSFYLGSGPGLYIDLEPIEIRNGINIGFITSPDSFLGGPVQFNEYAYVGARDRRHMGIGVQYDHLSSADIYPQNIGRDFLTIQLSYRW